MAEKHLTPKAEKRVKVITEHLERLDSFSKFLFTLAGLEVGSDSKDAVCLSLDTLEAFATVMDMAVDTISAELGLCKYERHPQADAYVLKVLSPAMNPSEALDSPETH